MEAGSDLGFGIEPLQISENWRDALGSARRPVIFWHFWLLN
jgi:hypothetical protein